MAYFSSATGRNQLYVQSTAAEGVTKIVSTDGGGSPRWRADGRELFYMSGVLVLRKEPTGQSPVSVVVNWPSMLQK